MERNNPKPCILDSEPKKNVLTPFSLTFLQGLQSCATFSKTGSIFHPQRSPKS